jgi:hypothetical protein
MAVERSRWTDERLDALEDRVMRQDVFEVRFDSLERRFDRLETRFDGLEQAVNGLRGELYSSRRWMLSMWITTSLMLLAVFVEIALRG